VREWMSRKVQMIRLSQNITRKATKKLATHAREFVIVDRVELPEVVAVAVAVGLGAAVAVAAGPVVNIVVRIWVTCVCVIAGLTPLSGYT
jgi:hypothetical protein